MIEIVANWDFVNMLNVKAVNQWMIDNKIEDNKDWGFDSNTTFDDAGKFWFRREADAIAFRLKFGL